jgi:hypothetical protein
MILVKIIPIIVMLLVAIFKDHLPSTLSAKKWVHNIIFILLVLTATINITIIIIDGNKSKALRQEIENVKIKASEVEKRTSIISNIEVRVFLDEITEARAITDKKTSIGRQSVVAFFDLNSKRYRFVTDYQFAHQQVTPTLHRGYLIYKPEEPSEILGKPIELLNQFMDFRVNYSEFLKYIGFSKTNKLNRITAVLYLNGIEMIMFKDIILEPATLFKDEIIFPIGTFFNSFDKKYYSLIDSRLQ